MSKTPSTPAIRLLKDNKVPFAEHHYRYEDHGGTRLCAEEFNVDEHCVIKTLIMEDENAKPMVVLMHGDREVSTKALARQLGCKAIQPCKPDTANRHSGYLVGGTSPFGTRRTMPVYMERSILELEKIFINGGSRGFLVAMDPKDVAMVLNPVLVEVSLRE
ncbi:MAG TPA: Cys-tRNA(Pro) deacylase [Holophaga sp.]|nr:Cys-tRNA(Pro) deacylase [Holophaga sp.]HPS67094.1 Cys-tRNA(Pro) deacylase [Holophaga sp.]